MRIIIIVLLMLSAVASQAQFRKDADFCESVLGAPIKEQPMTKYILRVYQSNGVYIMALFFSGRAEVVMYFVKGGKIDYDGALSLLSSNVPLAGTAFRPNMPNSGNVTFMLKNEYNDDVYINNRGRCIAVYNGQCLTISTEKMTSYASSLLEAIRN